MAYRNGTYVAFHANGTNIPGKSDIDYYNLMKAWTAKTDDEFTMNNSHDKAAAVRDSSKKATLRASLLERLRNSKNMVLIIGETTALDDDWVPFEIEKAVDIYKLPIIAAYTATGKPIRNPSALQAFWPSALTIRINNGTANIIHIPFKKVALMDAISQFSHKALPLGRGLGIYSDEAYVGFGIEG
ncbi:MAG: TIR domain-containing protein [Hydrogenophilales bacterium]|nr:TIR domain-containing protein [Hydrogenophilales bacterium]